MQKQVSILGCGWLGLPLAINLIDKGWEVKGSTTSSDKIEALQAEGIKAYKIKLDEHHISGDIQGFLKDSGLVIINIPPGLRRQPDSDFIAKLKPLTEAILAAKIPRILYVSSTGVFQDHESIPTFTEHYQFTPREIEDSQLLQAEDLLRNLKQVQTTLLRLSGLVGKNRHPVKFLSGKTGLKNPEAPVNLIHLDNCILLISEIIQQEKFGYVFHGNEDIQLSKEDYYSQKAEEFGLPEPEFNHEEKSAGKYISTEWTLKTLQINLNKH